MRKEAILENFKKIFVSTIPKSDKRCKLTHLDFIIGLVFCFTGDTKSFSLEAIREHLMNQYDVSISKSAFWERLAGRPIKKYLKNLLSEMITTLSLKAMLGNQLLSALGVKAILLIDSSSITLWDGAEKDYPGSRTVAGIKWHACFDLLKGSLVWFKTSPTSVHDRKCFPDIKMLKKKLIIFDLGYWDYKLLKQIEQAGGFFLSRIKSNSTIFIDGIIQGIKAKHIGTKLFELNFKKKKTNIIELVGSVFNDNEWQSYRIIGFWNPTEKKYHWYITNLLVSAKIIYTLYRIRWQIELIFKGCKSSFNLDGKVTSYNSNIIETLVLSSIVATFAAAIVLNIGADNLKKEKRSAISFQRVFQITVRLATHFINFLSGKHDNYIFTLMNKIKLFSKELYEKNFRKRPNTLTKLLNEICYV